MASRRLMLPLLVLLGIAISSCDALTYKRFSSSLDPCPKCGDPLFLTPLIEQGKIQEARNASEVHQNRFQSVKSHSGYLTVNKAAGSNMFFWYFEAAKNPKDAPVVLWLQGGPGASSLFGLFFENGPFRFRGRHVTRRPFSWHERNHLIYIDNPVGTGFSFTKSGYAKDETAVGKDLFTALTQFFKMFPELQKNEFYVTGESYDGKYVPAAAYAIHTKNPTSDVKINLKGFAIGNGFCDPVNQLKYSDYLYQIGLIDENGLNRMKDYETMGINYIKNKKWVDAYNIFDTLIDGDVYPYGSLFYNLTGFNFYFNYLQTVDTANNVAFQKLLDSPDVRNAIHVGNQAFGDGKDVQLNLREDMMQSVAGWVSQLLSHYRGLIYNGQLDIIVAYPLTVNFLKNLDFSSAAQYKTADRHFWIVDKEIAGYVKTAGNLTELLVRDAGHMVPTDQPKWAFDLISRFTQNKPFY